MYYYRPRPSSARTLAPDFSYWRLITRELASYWRLNTRASTSLPYVLSPSFPLRFRHFSLGAAVAARQFRFGLTAGVGAGGVATCNSSHHPSTSQEQPLSAGTQGVGVDPL